MTFSGNAPALLALDVQGLAEIEPRGDLPHTVRFRQGGGQPRIVPAPVSASCIVAEKEKHKDGRGWQ